jgi:hypothetical protein
MEDRNIGHCILEMVDHIKVGLAPRRNDEVYEADGAIALQQTPELQLLVAPSKLNRIR